MIDIQWRHILPKSDFIRFCSLVRLDGRTSDVIGSYFPSSSTNPKIQDSIIRYVLSVCLYKYSSKGEEKGVATSYCTSLILKSFSLKKTLHFLIFIFFLREHYISFPFCINLTVGWVTSTTLTSVN